MISGSFERRVQVPLNGNVGFDLRVTDLHARRYNLLDSIAVQLTFGEEASGLLRVGFILHRICVPCHAMFEGSASLYFLAMFISAQ